MENDRVISIVLSDAEWQALRQRHPQPVSWLKARIQESIGDRPRADRPAYFGDSGDGRRSV